MASSISYHTGVENQEAFGAAAQLRCAITTHSTEARVSVPFIRKIEGLMH
jgi:hypothetical protein